MSQNHRKTYFGYPGGSYLAVSMSQVTSHIYRYAIWKTKETSRRLLEASLQECTRAAKKLWIWISFGCKPGFKQRGDLCWTWSWGCSMAINQMAITRPYQGISYNHNQRETLFRNSKVAGSDYFTSIEETRRFQISTFSSTSFLVQTLPSHRTIIFFFTWVSILLWVVCIYLQFSGKTYMWQYSF